MSRYQKMARKATSVFVSLTTTIWLAGFGTLVPFAANAQTTADLQAQITALLAQITALQAQIAGGGASSGGGVSCGFTRSLTMGVQGEDVRCLQKYLNGAGHSVASTGVGSPGSESDYFGALTRTATASWQAANGVTPAVGYFGPISRAKYDSLIAALPPVPPVGGTPPPVTTTGTGITIGSASQPAATLAVQNAIHIPFTAFTLTASSDGNVLVDSVTVERTGLMNDAALAGIVLLDENMMQITQSPKSLNSNHQAILTDDFTVPAGQTKKFYLAGNMAASLTAYAGQVGTLDLVAVNSTAQVNGALPISGTGHTVNASLSVGSVTLIRGTNDPNTIVTKEVGTTDYIFSAIKATAGSAEDMVMKSMRWNQSGSASKDDLSNVIVVDTKSGTEYTPTVSADGKYYSVSFGSGINIKKGENTEVYIKADLASGSGRSVDFDLYRYDDFVFEGKTFGYKIKPSATEIAADNDDDSEFQDSQPRFDASQINIGTGSLRVEKSNDVQASNIANGNDGSELGAFKFDVDGEPISFTQWVITIATTDSDSGGENGVLTNITVYDSNGNAVAGPTDPVAAGTSVTLTDSVTVPVGDNIYTVRGDLNNNWENNDTIIVSFTPSSALSQVTGDTTGNTITPTPATSVAANVQTVKAGALVVTPSTSLSSQTLIEGSNGAELGRYVLDATNSGEDVKVTVIKIQGDVTLADINDFVSLQLFDGTTALNTGSNVLQPAATADGTDLTLSFTLDSSGLIIPKGSTKIISLKGNITTAADDSDAVKFDFSAGVNAGDWGTSGVDSGQDITETFSTAAGATITTQSGGGWKVSAAPSQPTEKWVTAGATGVTLNVLRFNATSEEFALTDLRLQIDLTGSSTGADFAKIYLYDGSTLLQSKTPAFTDGVEDFTFPTTGTGAFIMPKDGFKELTIKADLAPIGASQPGTAGQLVGVDYDGTTNTTKNKAQGKSSGTSKHSSTGDDVTGSGVVYFRSVPTVERVSIPQTTLTSGNQVLYKFKITADPAYDVAMHKATFSVATSGITAFSSSLPNLTLWNTTDNKRVAAATGTVAAMLGFVDNYNSSNQLIVRIIADTTDYSSTWVTIPAGQTHTFELRADVTTDGTSDSISTKLLGDSTRPANVTLTGAGARRMGKVTFIDPDKADFEVALNDNFIWADFSSDATTTHAITTADWMNAFKLPGLLSTGLDASTLSN